MPPYLLKQLPIAAPNNAKIPIINPIGGQSATIHININYKNISIKSPSIHIQYPQSFPQVFPL